MTQRLSQPDGLYVSVFMAHDQICSDMGVLLRHDQNLSLWRKNGRQIELVNAWELERLSGLKQHSPTLQSNDAALEVIASVLALEGYGLQDIEGFIGLEKGAQPVEVVGAEGIALHSLSHLFSAIFLNGSKFLANNAVLAFAVDAAPDNFCELDAFTKHFYSGAYAYDGGVRYFRVSSPGPLWSHSKKRFGLREGSLMALSTASSACFPPDYVPPCTVDQLLDRADWPAAFDYIDALIADAERLIVEELLLARGGHLDDAFSQKDNVVSMVMKVVQTKSNELMENNVRQAIAEFGVDPTSTSLGIAGGYGLNCPTNSYLMNTFGFRSLLAPACTNDTGISIGQALAYFAGHDPYSVTFPTYTPYLCASSRLKEDWRESFEAFIVDVEAFSAHQFLDDIEREPVVWLNGAAEIGPRALGNRSLLSDPRNLEMKNALNKIKKREWWRPVAPIVMEDRAFEFFEMHRPSPYMLELASIRAGMHSRIPAVAHLDQSARIQTLRREQNPETYDLIALFYEKTGLPLLCNTSLNDAGEPIIQTCTEALTFALRKGLNFAYLNHQRVSLHNHGSFHELLPARRPLAHHFEAKVDRPKGRPYTTEQLTYYWDNIHAFPEIDDMKAKDWQLINEEIARSKARFGYLVR